MLRPVSTVPLSKSAILELAKSACHYVEDIKNSDDWAHKYDEKILNPLPPTISALDLLQDEVQQDNFTTLCEGLDSILDGGVRCGSIIEICGAYGSGKTQICLQTSVTSQLPEECGGSNAEALYVDTRNGFSPRRIQDIIRGCQKRFPEVVLNEHEIMKGIKVSSPQNLQDLLLTVHNLKKRLRIGSKIGLVILDSLSLPVQCTFTDGWQRTQFYFRIIDELQKIADRNSVAVIIVNELRSHMDAEGKIAYESAGGQLVAHRAHKRLVVARLNDSTFAARILKASNLPQVSIKFRITEDGVRDQSRDRSPPDGE